MTNQGTIDKLIGMRLTSMSDGFVTQMNDMKMKNVPFEGRFGPLVDIEYNKIAATAEAPHRGAVDQPEVRFSTERINVTY